MFLLFDSLCVLMQIMKLNTDKILNELQRLGKTKTWLANKIKASPQNLSYILREKPITQAERIAKVFNIDPKDLIK